MGIISKTSSGVQAQPKPFPKLMVQRDRATRVVLFKSNNNGTVVMEDARGALYPGYYSTTWEMCAFDDYEGTVSLSNE